MKEVYCEDIINLEGKEVTLYGWVDSIRRHGKIAFIDLRDSSGIAQLVVKGDLLEKIEDLTEESVVKVSGTVVKRKVPNPNLKTGDYEVLVKEIDVLSKAERPIPIDYKNPDTSFGKRLDHRYLDLRLRENLLIFKIKSEVSDLIREFFHENGFIEVHPTGIISEASEGGADVFPIAYFDKEAYLVQSPQLHKQYLMASGFEKVFSVMPVWRAEPHHTTRHLCEYWSVDTEISFIRDHFDIMKVAEKMIKYIVKGLEDNKYVKELGIELPNVEKFEYISVKELKKKMYGEMRDLDISWEEEKKIGEEYLEKGVNFVFVYEYGWDYRPFYHMRKEGEPEVTKSFDVLFNGMEIITGSQREHRYEILLKQAKEKGVSIEKISWYLESFKYGMPPHGGFGFGLERFIMKLLNLDNIRKAILFPRDPERLSP